LPATGIGKGAYREYWRNGWQQKLLDLDGIMDRGINGSAARIGGKLICADWRLCKKEQFFSEPPAETLHLLSR
jgi:hypothetical protein